MSFVLFKKCLTGFADVITWQENEYIGIVLYRLEDFEIMASGMDFFFSDIYTEKKFHTIRKNKKVSTFR